MGDEWLYYKIYCGVRTADTILEECIAPVTANLLKKELISSWFFIRYRDSDPHLRLRFKIVNIKDLNIIIADFNRLISPYLQENLIWNVQTDSYVRELERYGSNTMEISEELFFHDSEFVLKAISLIKDEELLFLYTLKSVDMLVGQFALKDNEKKEFYKTKALAYKMEFKVSKNTKLSIDKKYRNLKVKFEATMRGEQLTKNHQHIIRAINKRNEQTNPLVKMLLRLDNSGALEVHLGGVISNHVHMNINRVFRDRQRFYEMLAYDFLARYQASKINRPKDCN